jgi:hypothetical protein
MCGCIIGMTVYMGAVLRRYQLVRPARIEIQILNDSIQPHPSWLSVTGRHFRLRDVSRVEPTILSLRESSNKSNREAATPRRLYNHSLPRHAPINEYPITRPTTAFPPPQNLADAPLASECPSSSSHASASTTSPFTSHHKTHNPQKTLP